MKRDRIAATRETMARRALRPDQVRREVCRLIEVAARGGREELAAKLGDLLTNEEYVNLRLWRNLALQVADGIDVDLRTRFPEVVEARRVENASAR